MKLEGLKINFLGDSITEGYHAVLAKQAKLAVARNYGISATKYAFQSGYPERPKTEADAQSFCERFTKMDDDADIVIVFGGTNDYGHGDAPIGGFYDRDYNTFYGACHYLYSGLIKKYLGKPIIIMTPLHRVGELKNTGSVKTWGCGTLRGYVNIIREVAEYYSLPVFDLYANSGLQPELAEIREKYIPDGLHPNAEGHKIIATKLKSFLEQL